MNVILHRYGRKLMIAIPAALLLLTPVWLAPQGQENPATVVPQADTCVIDPDGTAHITRVIPVPTNDQPGGAESSSRHPRGRGRTPRLPNGAPAPTFSALAGQKKRSSSFRWR